MNLTDFKAENPAYKDVPDETLADALHAKFYSAIPKDQFLAQVGVKPAGYGKWAAGGGTNEPTQTMDEQGNPLPMPDTPARVSVLEGRTLEPPPIDLNESARLERRRYAENTPLMTDPRLAAPSMRQGGAITRDANIDRGASFADSSLPVRAAAKAVTGGVQGLGGIVRAAGDLTGVDAVSNFGASAAQGANRFEQGMGKAALPEGFGPKSPVPYLTDMAEGAGASLLQSAALGAGVGARAVIPALSFMTAGQEYDKARQAGMDPAAALAGAVPKGIFEAAGEKFAGLDRVTSALGTLVKTGATDAAKRTAGDELMRAGIREIPGEVATYLGQTGVDAIPGIGLNPSLTMGQFLDGLRDTVVQSAMMGGVMAGGGHGVAHGTPALPPAQAPNAPPAPAPAVDPIAAIATAPTVDDAIAAATAAVAAPAGPSSADAIAQTLTAAAAPAASVQAVDNIGALLGVPPAPSAVAPVVPVAPEVGSTADRIRELEAQTTAPAATQGAENLQLERTPADIGNPTSQQNQQVTPSEVVTVTTPPAFTVTQNPDGTALVKGDPAAIRAQLADFGITSIVPTRGGILIGRSQAQRAQEVLAAAQPTPTANVQDTAPAAQQPTAATRTEAPAAERPAAAVPAQAVPAAGVAGAVETGGLTEAQAPAPPIEPTPAPPAASERARLEAQRATGSQANFTLRDQPAHIMATLLDGRPMELHRAGPGKYTAHNEAGDRIGSFTIVGQYDGTMTVKGADVAPSYRRQGVATAAYDALERAMGRRIAPAGGQSADGAAFWDSRRQRQAERAEGATSAAAADASPAEPRQSDRERLAAQRQPTARETERARLEAQREKARAADGSLLDKIVGATPPVKMRGEDARKLKAKFKEAGIDIEVADTTEDLPESARQSMQSQGVKGVRGMYDPTTDKTWIVLDKVNSPQEALFVALHESFHRGWSRTFGPKVRSAVDYLYLNNKTVRTAAKAYMDQHDVDRQTATEEILADMAGDGKAADLSGWDRLVAALKDWILKAAESLGVRMPVTDDMVQTLIAGARAQGLAERASGAEGEPKFSRAPATDTEAFKKWFGDSVVTEDGKPGGQPLVAYHGTASSDITEFLPQAREGSNTARSMAVAEQFRKLQAENGRMGYMNFRAGSFFSPDPAYAGNYTAENQGTMYPVYIKAENPVYMDQRTGKVTGLDPARTPDALIMRDGNKINEIAVLDPTQVKSATGNNGQYDAKNPDIRFSRVPPAAAGANLSSPQNWEAPEANRTDRVIYEMQDGRVDLKRVQQAIVEAGRKIDERFDARTAESLYSGRVAHRSETFLKAEVKPLLQAMALSKVKTDELADYLHARGAEERNAQIAKVNPDMPDGGAGKNSEGTLMTDAAAKAYLAAIPADRRKVLDTLAAKVDQITAGTRKLLVDEGIEKPEVVAAWEAAYKNYVPMFRDEAEAGAPHPTGAGFNVRGGNSKRATGSTKEVTNILAHVLMQREAAITRAEKNRVGMALYGLALENPNPEFWTTIRPNMQAAQIASELKAMGVDPLIAESGMAGVPTVRSVDPATDLVVDRPNPMYKSLPGAITLKVGGEDRVLMLNEKNERALRMAQSLKNLDGLTKFDLAGSIVGRTTRWLAAVNTQYNPAFGLVNGIRDTFGGALNLTSTLLKGKSSRVLFDAYTKAGPGIAAALSGKMSGDWAKLYHQFKEDGGQTGYRELWRDANDRARAIEKDLAQANKQGKLTAGKVGHAVLDLLDGMNTTIENAVRLAAYKAALDQGLSRPVSAKIARELTVDFNRKGRAGRELGPLYAFFNASVQGSARTIETLKGPAGKRVIAGGLALGVAQALMLAMMGYDDDEIPDFVKARAIIIPLGGKEKNYVAIPLPLGLHVLPNTGRIITEMVLNGGKDVGKRAFNAVGEIAGAFNPLGGGNIFTADGALKTALPTVVDPLVELGFNRNFAGNQIERENRGDTDPRPGFARAKESTQRSVTGQAYLGISKAINTLTGGSDYEAGLASPTPERVQYIAQTAGGGLLRELEKLINLAHAKEVGDKVPSSKIPVAGRLYGEVDDDAVQRSRYFEAGKRIDKAQAALKAAEKAGDVSAMQHIMADTPELLMGDAQNETAKAITQLNHLAVMTINDRKTLLEVDKARQELMKGFNQGLREMEAQTQKPTLAAKLKGIAGPQRIAEKTP